MKSVESLRKTLILGIPEKWDPGPETSTGGTLGPGTPKSLSGTQDPGPGTRDPKIFKWDPGLGTPKKETGTVKYLSETRNFQFSIVLIVYSTRNTLYFTSVCKFNPRKVPWN